ncbi:MAG: hypothetical protein R2832_15820 [Rhodothermales bacterium]
MKSLVTTLIVLLFVAINGTDAFGQNAKMQNFRPQDQDGINVFESPKDDVPFNGVAVKIGGSNTLQFQSLTASNSPDPNAELDPLLDLGSNFNLATSNLDLDVALADGVQMHLRTYLSSRHHPEPYVKGGYLKIDDFGFISESLAEPLKDITVKVGHMETNYGDNHFRRSDNGQAIFNPFVGNYIMDSFTTEVGGEVYYRSNGVIVMVGATNTKLNQSTVKTNPKTKPAIVAKVGYDKQLNEDTRVRITGSIYTVSQAARTYLYAGDRAGARYYNVVATSTDDFRTGRFDPGFRNELTAIMVNPFVKFMGFEFYGVFENSSGKAASETDTRTFNQYGAEALYRVGEEENFYLGGRYNLVKGKTSANEDVEINRINVGGGWFLTKNILAKLEYVKQQYKGFNPASIYAGAEFSGVALEAVVSF